MVLTIPFGVAPKDMQGFVSVTGKENELPLLTICVQNINLDKCTVTNMVFPDVKTYSDFIDRLFIDSRKYFNVNEVVQ